MAGLLSWDQLTLPAGLIALPSNVGSSIDSGSVKSLNHPTFGQIATFALGMPQNFVYSVSCGTFRKFRLNPSLLNSVCATCAVCRPGSALVAMVNSFGPGYLPLESTGTPSALAFSMYCFARAGSPPIGCCIQSNPGKPALPPDSA